jgi:hypothetical protein
MSLRRVEFSFCLFFLLLPSLLRSETPDQLESIIKESHEEVDAWSSLGEELPPIFLLGDQKGVQIYFPAQDDVESGSLCGSVDFDKLFDAAFQKKDFIPGDTVVLNTAAPRVREMLSEACLVRPGDALLAIGQGWQTFVTITDFVVKAERALCPNDPPYSLWVFFDEKLPGVPLFFSSDNRFHPGGNQFAPVPQPPLFHLDPVFENQLKDRVQFYSDYRPSVFEVNAENIEKLILLNRENVGHADAGLPNQILLWEKKGEVGELLLERVSEFKASGHIYIEGIFDYNGDGFTDVLVGGDREGCPYRALFEGELTGLHRVDLPFKPCQC